MNATVPISTPRHELQFSLRSLLVALGAVCLLLAPVQWFGGVYLVSAFCSVLLIILCTLAYRRTPAMAFLPAGIGLVLAFLLAIGLLVFFLHALANFVACLILIAIRVRPRAFAIALTCVMAAVYGFAFSLGAAKLNELRELRVRYPLESLSSRLAFEQTFPSSESVVQEGVQMSPAVAKNLQQQEISLGQVQHFYSRTDALRDLHEDSSAEFVRAAGFGVMRMPSLTYRLVVVDQPEALTFPRPIGISLPLSSNTDLETVHRVAINDFLLADRMGYIKSRNAVAGFESHQFGQLSRKWEHELPAAKRWQVIRLELVGLLRDKPRVYISEALPPLDKIAVAPSRPLNDFESNALPRLTSQEDVVVDQQPERIQMLGALRASTSCLQCHEGASGRLLGAFSYEIVPIGAPEKSNGAAGN